MKSKIALIAVCSALAAGSLAACREGLTGVGIGDQGVFFVTVGGHKDSTFRGEAAFYKTFEDGMETLTLYFVNDGGRFELTFALRDYTGSLEPYDLDLDPDRYSGSFSYVAGGQRVTYAVTGGVLQFTSIGKLVLEGEIDFDGIVTEGANTGNTGRVHGTFVAVCEGECLGSEPPPGS